MNATGTICFITFPVRFYELGTPPSRGEVKTTNLSVCAAFSAVLSGYQRRRKD